MTNLKIEVTVSWNQQVQADRTIPTAKPDIIIRDNEEGTCVLVDVAISGPKMFELWGACNRYKHMWTVQTRVMPVILAATEAISKTFRKYLKDVNLPGRHDCKELQKRAVLSSARVLWRVLMWKWKTFQQGKSYLLQRHGLFQVYNYTCPLWKWHK